METPWTNIKCDLLFGSVGVVEPYQVLSMYNTGFKIHA
jgi:hypothetical protein